MRGLAMEIKWRMLKYQRSCSKPKQTLRWRYGWKPLTKSRSSVMQQGYILIAA